jgi:hypothetical protein
MKKKKIIVKKITKGKGKKSRQKVIKTKKYKFFTPSQEIEIKIGSTNINPN